MLAIDDPLQPLAWDLLDLSWKQEVEPSRLRFQDKGTRNDVLRRLVERRCKLEEFLSGQPATGRILTTRACPCVRVPVLSITRTRTRASVSSALPPFTSTPALAARDTPETMATGTARIRGQGVAINEHGQRPDRIAAPQPRPAGEHDRQRQERHGEPVGEPRHRRLRGLSGLDQANDAGIGALGGAVGRRQVERVADVRHAAHDRLAGLLLDRDRLACQRRLIEDGHPFGDKPVHRHDIALADEQPVLRLDDVETNLLKSAVSIADGCPRHASQERRHLAVGAALGKVLQILSARIHQGHDDGGEVLPEHKRAGHGEGGNDVQADIPAPQAGDDLDEQCAQDRKGRRGPDCPGPLSVPGNTRCEAQE